jgi:hypothetical protein
MNAHLQKKGSREQGIKKNFSSGSKAQFKKRCIARRKAAPSVRNAASLRKAAKARFR